MSKSSKSKPSYRFFPPALRDQMREDLVLAGKAERTVAGYLRAVRRLSEFCHKRPDKITEKHVRQYFLYLREEEKYATETMTVELSGIKFFYRVTCQRDWASLAQIRVRTTQALPDVISIEQVHQIIDACTTLRMAVFFWTVYSLGLRISEALNLQVGDIDSKRGLVHVHRGKGAKDRFIPLPQSTLRGLRMFWATHKNPTWIFRAEGRDHKGSPTATTPMALTTPQDAMKLISKKLGFAKKVSTHTLRHSYATHLFEANGAAECDSEMVGTQEPVDDVGLSASDREA
ncbi:MAG: site-specific integrase [Planctomycetota bacterium]